MSLNSIFIKLLTVFVSLLLVAALFIAIPTLSGSMREDEVKPMLVINSINFHEKIVPQQKKVKKKQKIVKKKPIKKPKKITKVIKKKQPVIKKKIIKKIDEKFAFKNKKQQRKVKQQEEVIPVPEPIYRVTEKPYYIKAIIPIYPMDMYRLGKTASVTVDALIDRKGKVRKATIYKSAGKSFDDAAIQAIKSSVFSPGKINGKPVAVLYRADINFVIK